MSYEEYRKRFDRLLAEKAAQRAAMLAKLKRYQPNPDYGELLGALLVTKADLRNATIAGLMPGRSSC
jgi:hypothetical protein